ncbi:SDR family oxidoreductase [Nocardioides sp. NPDC006273]|uniref:SDR family oxidoreductase n=1 Tax=Nocardioides sp. NPDC006273 TaxID=3155598 RepID=UPI0033B57971
MTLLDDHVVLITGSGSGLGLGIARHFQQEGAQLALLEYDDDKVRTLRDEFGDDVVVVHGDVRSLDDLERCRDEIVARFGRLTAVVGAQGIWDGNVRLRDIPADRVDSLLDEVFAVNVKGYALTARVFLDLLDAEQGALVLTCSQAAFAADGGGIAYTASKGAVRSLVNQLSFELAPRIRVNAVAPTGIANSQLRGPAALDLQDSKQSDIPADAFRQQFEWLAPMQHMPSPEEYGPLYAFLASRQNTIMTGQTVLADQGSLNRALISMGDLLTTMPRA